MHGLSHGACATYQQIVCAIHVPDGISCSGTAATHVCLKRSGWYALFIIRGIFRRSAFTSSTTDMHLRCSEVGNSCE